MKRTTVFLEEAQERDIQSLARRQGRPVAAVVREALARYVRDEKRRSNLRLSFLGVGRSGHRDTSERHDELLFRDIEPRRRKVRSARARKR